MNPGLLLGRQHKFGQQSGNIYIDIRKKKSAAYLSQTGKSNSVRPDSRNWQVHLPIMHGKVYRQSIRLFWSGRADVRAAESVGNVGDKRQVVADNYSDNDELSSPGELRAADLYEQAFQRRYQTRLLRTLANRSTFNNQQSTLVTRRPDCQMGKIPSNLGYRVMQNLNGWLLLFDSQRRRGKSYL